MYKLSRPYPIITERKEYKELIALGISDQAIRRFIRSGYCISEIRKGKWIETDIGKFWLPNEIYILVKN